MYTFIYFIYFVDWLIRWFIYCLYYYVFLIEIDFLTQNRDQFLSFIIYIYVIYILYVYYCRGVNFSNYFCIIIIYYYYYYIIYCRLVHNFITDFFILLYFNSSTYFYIIYVSYVSQDFHYQYDIYIILIFFLSTIGKTRTQLFFGNNNVK